MRKRRRSLSGDRAPRCRENSGTVQARRLQAATEALATGSSRSPDPRRPGPPAGVLVTTPGDGAWPPGPPTPLSPFSMWQDAHRETTKADAGPMGAQFTAVQDVEPRVREREVGVARADPDR